MKKEDPLEAWQTEIPARMAGEDDAIVAPWRTRARTQEQRMMERAEDIGRRVSPTRRATERANVAPNQQGPQYPPNLTERLRICEQQFEYYRELSYRLSAENERLNEQH